MQDWEKRNVDLIIYKPPALHHNQICFCKFALLELILKLVIFSLLS